MVSKSGDYQKVINDIKAILKQEKWDDGSIGPVLIRLAWHASGTYCKATGTGGSDGATMRFPSESGDPANAGLHLARAFLDPIKQKHPWITYADLWTLAGAVSIEEMGGPHITWAPGRRDAVDETNAPPQGRLPDASKAADHVRDVFYRMGLNDREIVALIGAHTLGRCHKDRSGYEGAWTFTPTRFSNQFYVQLVKNTWTQRKWDGPIQFTDPTGELMMLPADMVFLSDPEFRKYAELYANDKKVFFEDFAAAFSKLLELGVKRPKL